LRAKFTNESNFLFVKLGEEVVCWNVA